ncbi:hypothetical protein BJY59DRAFT_24569 [Rhodotorula toruloides]
MERFVANSSVTRLPLAPPHFQPGLNSYQRLLIHRLADMFGITREVEAAPPTMWNAGIINPATGQPQGVVVLVKGEATTIPPHKLASYVPAPDPVPSASPRSFRHRLDNRRVLLLCTTDSRPSASLQDPASCERVPHRVFGFVLRRRRGRWRVEREWRNECEREGSTRLDSRGARGGVQRSARSHLQRPRGGPLDDREHQCSVVCCGRGLGVSTVAWSRDHPAVFGGFDVLAQ